MPPSRLALVLSAALLPVVTPALADGPAPIRVIEDSLEVPEGMTVTEALSAVEDMATLFELYEPVVPWIPGVKLDLEKELVSAESPVVVELPIAGAAFGRTIEERARVTATTTALTCPEGEGLRIELAFEASTHNIERRIDRIDIAACPRTTAEGLVYIDARGELFEGHTPRDPDLNAFNENVGAKALQTAFLKQVPAVFEAVEQSWQVARANPSPNAAGLLETPETEDPGRS